MWSVIGLNSFSHSHQLPASTADPGNTLQIQLLVKSAQSAVINSQLTPPTMMDSQLVLPIVTVSPDMNNAPEVMASAKEHIHNIIKVGNSGKDCWNNSQDES